MFTVLVHHNSRAIKAGASHHDGFSVVHLTVTDRNGTEHQSRYFFDKHMADYVDRVVAAINNADPMRLPTDACEIAEPIE